MRNLILMFVLITNVIFSQGQKVEIIENLQITETFRKIKDFDGVDIIQNNDIFNIDNNSPIIYYIQNNDIFTNRGISCELVNSSKEEYMLLQSVKNNNIIKLDLTNSPNKIINISMNMCLNSYIIDKTNDGKIKIVKSDEGNVIMKFEESYNINGPWNVVHSISNPETNVWFNKEVTYDFNVNKMDKIYIRISFDNGDVKKSFSIDDLKITSIDEELYPEFKLSNESFLKNNTIVALNDNYLEIKSENVIKNVMVYDFSGREVRNIASTNIEVSDLASGLYIVKVVDSYNNVTNKKFLKK